MAYGYGQWAPYVSVAERQSRAMKKIAALKKKGRRITPVVIEGREIASTFWGQAWCTNLEAYSDLASRLPRGRSYVRNGSVVDLQVAPGRVTALVSGTELYEVDVTVKPVGKVPWQSIAAACAGQIDSLVELLAGKLSHGVMAILVDKKGGLFPKPRELSFTCSCPDYATMCKHVAAVLYGVGARLDEAPELLFTLRGAKAAELIEKAARGAGRARVASKAKRLGEGELGAIFGIEMEAVPEVRKRQAKRK